jgi:FkbH-like protein
MYQLTWRDEKLWGEKDEVIDSPPLDRVVEKAALLLWVEHCVECAVPYCYSSCPLYVERRDKKCARFTYGIYPNPNFSGLYSYGADITFRRWGKLESYWPGTPKLFYLKQLTACATISKKLENLVTTAAELFKSISPNRRLNGILIYLRGHWVKWSQQTSKKSEIPDALYIKFFSPNSENHTLQLEITYSEPVYRTSISANPGWNERVIPFKELPTEDGKTGSIRLWPSDNAEIRLIFTWLDLVTWKETFSEKPADKVKCVAWDLDNTLWDGVIGDDGFDGITVHPQMIQLIKDLDTRGILQTIVSKNDYETAWEKIEALEIAEYFIYPAIHWGRKSESLRMIADELNINVDTLAVIDDSAYERDEISETFPQVRVYDVKDVSSLLSRSEFDVPITEVSRNRRQAYIAESERKTIQASWGNDFEGFLGGCEMVMTISRPQGPAKTRCLELLQRSNQFNLSGRRYSEDEFNELLENENYECFSFEVSDKFGDHGIIAFTASNIERETPVIADFVMSCRVAQKMVDETILWWYAYRVQERGAKSLQSSINTTDRNRPLREVFDALPFKEKSGNGTKRLLECNFDTTVSIPTVITIRDQT